MLIDFICNDVEQTEKKSNRLPCRMRMSSRRACMHHIDLARMQMQVLHLPNTYII